MSDTGQPAPAREPTLLRAASLLTAANLVAVLSGLLTAPLIARALAPEGRGLLAAVVAPLAIASQLGQLSLGEYATQQIARGVRVGQVVGSLVPVMLIAGVVSAGALILLAPTVAAGEDLVEQYLVIGALVLPVGLLIPLCTGVASGRRRWGLSAASQAVGPVSYTVAIVVLAVVDELSVDTAVVATIGSGLTALVMFGWTSRRESWRALHFARETARGGISYGGRAFAGVVAVFANGRLDQILMLSLSSARQLGLYAVAVTYASMARVFVTSVGMAIMPAVAAGDRDLIARTCRLTLAVSLISSTVLAALSVPLFHLMFGSAFADAIPMALILLAGQLAAAGCLVVGIGLRSLGYPGIVSVVDVIALAVTIPGLILLLPALGGIGASIVSVTTFALTFGALTVVASRRTSIPAREFVAVRMVDLVDAAHRLVSAVRSRIPSRSRG